MDYNIQFSYENQNQNSYLMATAAEKSDRVSAADDDF